jgi:hypothetical protein
LLQGVAPVLRAGAGRPFRRLSNELGRAFDRRRSLANPEERVGSDNKPSKAGECVCWAVMTIGNNPELAILWRDLAGLKLVSRAE